jgi:hypothetical protein
MTLLKRLADRLSYANVMATIALFVGLGGASYAAFVLPPHSVGSRQLKRRAVTPGALSFPLGAAGVTDKRVQDLSKNLCNSPAPPGVAKTVDCPELKRLGVSTPGREVQFDLKTHGRVLVSTVAGLEDAGANGTRAAVSIYLVLDGHLQAPDSVTLSGGQMLQVPAQQEVALTPGHHRVGVEIAATYSSYAPGDVLVSSVSLNASAGPSL